MRRAKFEHVKAKAEVEDHHLSCGRPLPPSPPHPPLLPPVAKHDARLCKEEEAQQSVIRTWQVNGMRDHVPANDPPPRHIPPSSPSRQEAQEGSRRHGPGGGCRRQRREPRGARRTKVIAARQRMRRGICRQTLSPPLSFPPHCRVPLRWCSLLGAGS